MELTLHVCVLRTNSMPEFTYQTMSPAALPNVWGTQDLQQEEVQLACDFVHLKQIYIVSPAVFSRCWCTQDLQQEEVQLARNFAPGGQPKHTRGSSDPQMLQQHWQQHNPSAAQPLLDHLQVSSTDVQKELASLGSNKSRQPRCLCCSSHCWPHTRSAS